MIKRGWVIAARLIAIVAVALIASCGGGGGGTTINTVNTQSGLKSFVQFAISNPAANGIINEQNKTIAVTVPFGTNVTALNANFTITGVSVSVSGVTQVSGITANNFTSPVKYVVTAEDGSTVTYTVTVTVASNSAKAITAFSFNNPAATGVINESGKTITVTVPSGTNVSTLVDAFTTTGQSVTVGGIAQVSGVTANNFSNATLFRVTAADNSYVDYTVMVIVAPSSAKAIIDFTFPSLNASGIINETAKTIMVTVPSGTNVTSQVASFATTGVSVAVGGITQVSGTTANNFTAPLTYAVTAADGSVANYTVTVATPGVNWIARTSGTANPLDNITFSGMQFVAVGWAGTILTSPDGINWVTRTSGTVNNLYGIVGSGTQFVVTGLAGTILTSPDGVIWTTRTTGTANALSSVAWSGTLYAAVGAAGTILTSPDGITWTARTSGTANALSSVVWSGTQFVVVGDLGTILTSPDGITWTARTWGGFNANFPGKNSRRP